MDSKRVRKAQAPVAEAPAVSAPVVVAATVGAKARDNDTKVEETASPSKETMDSKRVRKAQAPVAEAPAVSAPVVVAATVGAKASAYEIDTLTCESWNLLQAPGLKKNTQVFLMVCR